MFENIVDFTALLRYSLHLFVYVIEGRYVTFKEHIDAGVGV